MSYKTEAELVSAIEQAHADALAMVNFAGDVRACLITNDGAVDVWGMASCLRFKIEAAVAHWPEMADLRNLEPEFLSVALANPIPEVGPLKAASWHAMAHRLGREARHAWETAEEVEASRLGYHRLLEHATDGYAVVRRLKACIDETSGHDSAISRSLPDFDMETIQAHLARESQATYEKLVKGFGEPAEVALSNEVPEMAVSDFEHSDPCDWVRWNGTDYSFSATQAACVRLLITAHKSGRPHVSGAELLEAAESASTKVSDLFKKSDAWNTLIVSPKRGHYCLATEKK